MDIRFDGKRALVTGAGRGIGRAVAKALHAGGAETFALNRTQSYLDSLKEECPGMHTVCVDLSDWDATRKAVQDICPIHLLVNNAGVSFVDSFLDVKPDHFDKMIEINLKAALNVSQVVANSMKETGKGGSIVNVSSQASLLPLANHTGYGASKGGLDQMTKVMALELGQYQIRVNTVNPTVTMTDMSRKYWCVPERERQMLDRIPLGRFAELNDVVEPIMYLLSDKAAMIHGAAIPIDGGACCS